VSSPRKEHARELFAGIASDYDRWAQLLSFGHDRRWHEVLNDRLGARPDDIVADVATGTAAVAIDLARRHGCRVIGVDQSGAMLDRGRQRVHESGLADRIELRLGEAESLPLEDESVDALIHTYLLRYVDDVPATLRELVRPVRPGGPIASLDFAVPAGGWYPAWWAWTRLGLPAGGLIARDGWYATGRFLGPSIERFWRDHPLDDLLAAWSAAGVEDLRWQRLSLGGAVIIRGIKS
jgi:demethylmenaquinone methyltransferase/2-methoxy-6-polyprenyl-1,4-benzoquinol methylase